jgi:CTP synthase
MSIKYIFVTGGVLSSLGKGITAASIAKLLEGHGISVAILKLDPYLNVDPGTMNPFQHGEVYVTDDGAETDLDLGHYHRFTNSPLSKYSNATSGQIYETVIKKERKGEYLGKDVQIIPDVTNEIKNRIDLCAKQNPDTKVVIVEIGGTVGDIESLPFLEAIRQYRNDHPEDCINIHLTYVPYLKAAGEVKTKPTQHSTRELRSIGIFPDFILCRSEVSLSDEIKQKISLFCNVPVESVIEEKDVKHSIYEVPLDLAKQHLDLLVMQKLGLPAKRLNLSHWENLIEKIVAPKEKVKIGLVGKYVEHKDAYKSVFEALHHAALENSVDIEIVSIDSEKVSSLEDIPLCSGYLIPGGFGKRGLDGKILAAQYARENNIPYFGICLGMQVMIIEFAKNVLKLEAHSTEIDPKTPYPVISLLEEQKNREDMGGTMRLGAYPCSIEKKSKAFAAYKLEEVLERHRHRFEFNHEYKSLFEEKGMLFSGSLTGKNLLEIAEIKSHPWMVGVQFHPEFLSKPLDPHPLFVAFIKASLTQKALV